MNRKRRTHAVVGLVAVIGVAVLGWWWSRSYVSNPPAIRVALLDPVAGPRAKCRATLWRDVEGGKKTAVRFQRSCRSVLRWENLEPGIWHVVVQASRRALIDHVVTLDVETVADIELRFAPGGDIVGKVRDGGTPVPEAWIAVGGLRRAPIRSDADGGYAFRGVPVGPWRLRAFARRPDRAVEAGAMVTEGEAIRIDLDLQPTELPGVLGLRFQAVDEGAEVTAVKPGGGAEACGLQSGMVILEADAHPLHGLTDLELRERMLGPSGSSVLLRVSFEGAESTLDCERLAG